MPEEINRILTDQISDLLFVTEPSALKNLHAEGIPDDRIHFVGNTMIDSLREFESKADLSSVRENFGLKCGNYALLTLHRAANVDDRDSFLEILEGLRELARSYRIIFPVHPRTRKQIHEHGLESYFLDASFNYQPTAVGIAMYSAQGYLDFLCLMKHAHLVVTDSGGIQEETTALGVPCVTARENTERPVTVEVGTNILAGTDRASIRHAVRQQLAFRGKRQIPQKWDGMASGRIVQILADKLIPEGSVVRALETSIAPLQKNA
jgi:UDP-N-acetylglucosamine 2-epimerase (non-hydrolysing)